VIQRFYDAGVYPDWWKLEPLKRSRLGRCRCDAIDAQRPAHARHRGAGARRAEAALAESFALAAQQPLVKGFAVGRTIFGDAARAWMAGEMTMTRLWPRWPERYDALCAAWDRAREG
jgi:5-dehydro-2-deoxygluconokinase